MTKIRGASRCVKIIFFNLFFRVAEIFLFNFPLHFHTFLVIKWILDMFERFKFGSYRINEESELANSKKIKSNKTLTVLVKFADNTNVKFAIDVSKIHFYYASFVPKCDAGRHR